LSNTRNPSFAKNLTRTPICDSLQSIGFYRLFLSTGEVCFQKNVRVSSPPNLAVLKNPIFIRPGILDFGNRSVCPERSVGPSSPPKSTSLSNPGLGNPGRENSYGYHFTKRLDSVQHQSAETNNC
jgi:hypothetical protein